MSHPSVSKSKSPRARKTVSVTDTARGHPLNKRDAVMTERSWEHLPMREQSWMLLAQDLIKKNDLSVTVDGSYLNFAVPDQPGGTPSHIDMNYFATGVELLAERLLVYFLSHQGKEPPVRKINGDFAQVYAILVQGAPAGQRGQLLKDMRNGLDEAAKDMLAPTVRAHAGDAGNVNAADDEVAIDETPLPRPPSDDPPVSTADFMANLARQEASERARDIKEGLLVTAGELAAQLQLTAQALHQARKSRRMFALQGASGELLYPAFFADRKLDRKVLEAVSKALGSLPGSAKWDFFLSPRLSFGGKTPLQLLEKGKVDIVISAAQAFAEE